MAIFLANMFAFGELVDADIVAKYIDGVNDYHRCPWLVEIGGAKYVCLLLPHDGDVHKILDQGGSIRTRRVVERERWWKGLKIT